MISYTQILGFLTEKFPEMAGNAPILPASVDQLHRVIDSFAKLTRELIEVGDFALVKCCFSLADQLLSRGDGVLQRTVETNFLRTLHLDCPGSHNAVARRLLPTTLKKAYYTMVTPPVAS